MREPPAPGTDLPAAPRPGLVPGDPAPKRLLEQAPSDRLAARAAAREPTRAEAGSAGRALVYGAAAAGAGATVHVLAATLLLWTAGLLVVAAMAGTAVGLAVALGAGRSLAPAARRGVAIALALGAVAVAFGIDWGLSGMYLGPLDYLAQVYGPLAALELPLAVAGALAGSR
jgi:hypothetical protein